MELHLFFFFWEERFFPWNHFHEKFREIDFTEKILLSLNLPKYTNLNSIYDLLLNKLFDAFCSMYKNETYSTMITRLNFLQKKILFMTDVVQSKFIYQSNFSLALCACWVIYLISIASCGSCRVPIIHCVQIRGNPGMATLPSGQPGHV